MPAGETKSLETGCALPPAPRGDTTKPAWPLQRAGKVQGEVGEPPDAGPRATLCVAPRPSPPLQVGMSARGRCWQRLFSRSAPMRFCLRGGASFAFSSSSPPVVCPFLPPCGCIPMGVGRGACTRLHCAFRTRRRLGLVRVKFLGRHASEGECLPGQRGRIPGKARVLCCSGPGRAVGRRRTLPPRDGRRDRPHP